VKKYLREQRRGKPIVEQKRKNTYDSMIERKTTYDVMRQGKSQHIEERAKVRDNR
jgi:hypothetical protein